MSGHREESSLAENRRVLVTGASRGIGRSIADLFRDRGHRLETPPHTELDLSDVASVERYTERRGREIDVDILVNNAGENRIRTIADISLEEWQRTLTVNLTAAFLLLRAVAEPMARRGWGRIVNVGSVYGKLARPGRVAYSASKAGLDAVTRTAALEYGPRGVLVNSVCPGFIDTELTRRNNTTEQLEVLALQTAVRRLAQPEEIAQLVYFLGSEANTFVTGQSIVADGGFSIQ